MRFFLLLTISLLLTGGVIFLSSCASKPIDPALMQAHQTFTSKLTLPQ